MTQELTPEQQLRLKVKFDTEYEFLLENGYIEPDESVSQSDIEDIARNLSDAEQDRLEARLDERQKRLEEIMGRDLKVYPGPHVRYEDIVSGVRLPGFYDKE